MEVLFKAQIKDFNTRTTVSADKTTRIMLEADNLATEIRNKVNELQDHALNESKELIIQISDE